MGEFSVSIPPGRYHIVVTRGIEFSHLQKTVTVEAGKTVAVSGTLRRLVDTTGWVGVVALFFLMSPAITTLPMMPKALGGWRWKRSQRAGYVALVLVVVHLVALGVKGWLAPRGWHGGLPPISMMALLVALTPLLAKRKVIREEQKRAEWGS
jgi:DMSO/TMAO reductase YedYZ heme-binding membrane subunit